MAAQGISLVVLHKSLASIYAMSVVTLRPNGAATWQPRASPWVCDTQFPRALKGRNKQSISNVPFIQLKPMATHEHAILFQQRHHPMMLFPTRFNDNDCGMPGPRLLRPFRAPTLLCSGPQGVALG